MMNHQLILSLLFVHSISFGQSQSVDWEVLSTLPQGTDIAVGIFENGHIEKYGFVNEKSGLKITGNANRLFEVGSITKVFTTLSALQTLDKGQIERHESIARYLPENAEEASERITFYQLMTHTSGFPKMPGNFLWSALRCPGDPFLHYCEERMIRFINRFTPRENEDFAYSNLGMGLLGYLCSHLERTSLDSIMKREVFQPIKMKSTSLGISSNQFPSVVNPPRSNGEPKGTWKFSEATQGAGNVYSNIDDMTLFLKFILGSENYSKELFQSILDMERQEIRVSESESMGLGWRIHHSKSQIIYHGGITYGFKSLIAYNRLQAKGIVILTNAKGLSRKENAILREVCFKFLQGAG